MVGKEKLLCAVTRNTAPLSRPLPAGGFLLLVNQFTNHC